MMPNRNRMSPRRGSKRPPPIFQGAPSPSLAKMARMTRQQLEVQAQNLATEAQRLRTKIEHLKIQNPVPQDRIANLTAAAARLDGLVKVAQERMATAGQGGGEPRQPWRSRPRPAGPPR